MTVQLNSVNSDKMKYYNHPLENNAYFLAAASTLYDIVKNIKTVEQFNKLFGTDNREFLPKFWNYISQTHPNILKYINQTYKTKWNKRIYQLYDELKSKIKD
jgi:hypothetical protein